MNNIETLLAALVNPAQTLVDTFTHFLAERFVDTAVGAQLEIIGRIVGQGREGLIDADYRRYIRARIVANNSNGTIDNILVVASLVVYDVGVSYIIDNQGSAAVVLRLTNKAVPDNVANILVRFLRVTGAAGVRVILEYSPLAPSTWFTWDTVGLGWDNGKFINAIC